MAVKDIMNENLKHLTEDSCEQKVQSPSSLVTSFKLEPPSEYEDIIQKLECDVRTNIRIQNQLKIHLDTAQWRIEELEKKRNPA